MTANQVPFIDLMAQQQRIRGRIDQAIQKVLDHGKFIMGPEVFELECALAGFAGCKEVVSCSSGTDAIWLPLLAHEVGPGDAVVCPSFTFTATAEAVALTGATPVFADVEGRSFNISPDSVEAAIATARAQGLTPRAVIPVDLFGLPANYARINEIAADHELLVLGDAAQSFGAAVGDTRVGALADVTGTSFFPAKPLGCYGDGGAIFTDSEEFAETLRSIRIHGRGGGGKYDNVRVGTNARLDTMQAAVVLEKLEIFPEELQLRQRVADRYNDALGEVVATPEVPAGVASAWAQYTVLVDQRDALQAALKDRGVPSQVYYPRPLHLQRPFQHAVLPEGGLPVTERLAKQVLSLPMYPYLPTDQQDQVIGAVRDCVRELAGGLSAQSV